MNSVIQNLNTPMPNTPSLKNDKYYQENLGKQGAYLHGALFVLGAGLGAVHTKEKNVSKVLRNSTLSAFATIGATSLFGILTRLSEPKYNHNKEYKIRNNFLSKQNSSINLNKTKNQFLAWMGACSVGGIAGAIIASKQQFKKNLKTFNTFGGAAVGLLATAGIYNMAFAINKITNKDK